LKEKLLLERSGFNPKDFLRIKSGAEFYEFLQISTGKVLTIRR
jgi:hypothetical protein